MAINIKPIPKSRSLLLPDLGLNHIACAENWHNVRNHFPYFNVLDYGAKGDGVTDDTASIQRAVTAAPIRGKILFPPGAYIVSSRITGFKAGVSIWGYGAIIQRADHSIDAWANSGEIFSFDQDDIAVYGLWMDGRKSTNDPSANNKGDLIRFEAANRGIVEDCRFYDFARDAITLSSSSNDCIINNNRFTGIGLRSTINGGSGVPITYGSRNIISNNVFKGDATNASAAVSAVDIEPNTGTDICTGNVVIGNVIDMVRIDQAMACYTGDVAGPSYPSQENSFIGNTVYSSDTSKSGAYAFQGRNCKGLIFSNNNLRHGASYCCVIKGAYAKECKITNNNFQDSAGIGLCIPDSAVDFEITGNRSSGHALDGISINGGNFPRVNGNICERNGNRGIVLSGHAYAQVQGNTTYLNGYDGIYLYSCTDTNVIGNTCIDDGQAADNTYSSILTGGATGDRIRILNNVVGSNSGTTNKVKYCVNNSVTFVTSGSLQVHGNTYKSYSTGKTNFNTASTGQLLDENYDGGTSGTLFALRGVFDWGYCVGTPEGAVSARPGSIRTRTDGAKGTQVYFKDAGTGNTGWQPMISMNGSTPSSKRIPYGFNDGTDTYLQQSPNFTYDDSAKILSVDADLKLTVAGNGIFIKEGTNASMGRATLVAGTVTVNNTKVTANTEVFVQRQTDGGTVAASYSVTRVAGTSFTLTAKDGAGANQTLDTSTLAWWLAEPA